MFFELDADTLCFVLCEQMFFLICAIWCFGLSRQNDVGFGHHLVKWKALNPTFKFNYPDKVRASVLRPRQSPTRIALTMWLSRRSPSNNILHIFYIVAGDPDKVRPSYLNWITHCFALKKNQQSPHCFDRVAEPSGFLENGGWAIRPNS